MINEINRFGSSRWPMPHEVKDAGLIGAQPTLGFFEGQPVGVAGDSPLLTVAGSGAGKARDILLPLILQMPAGINMGLLDLKGELGAVTRGHLIQSQPAKAGFFINAFGLHGLPQHNVNPLAILRPDSLTLDPDCMVIAESVITATGGGNSEYFEGRARNAVEKASKYRTIKYGGTTLPEVYHRTLRPMDGDPEGWKLIAEDMQRCGLEDVRQFALEASQKMKDAPGEFSAIMGTIHANFNPLTQPAIERCLQGGDFSLEVLSDPAHRCNIYIQIPAEFVGVLGSFLRLLFTVMTMVKQRSPDAPPLYLLCDESAQLKRAEFLERAVVYGRGAKIRTHTVWQDLGQITRYYGSSGLQTFLGSSQTRQAFGTRDSISARIWEEMLGTETLEYDEPFQQAGARQGKMNAVYGMFNGADPIKAAFDAAHYSHAAQLRGKQARPLMTAAEIMALPEDEQLLFISGVNCPPLRAGRKPYYRQAQLAGRYLENPYHERGTVQIATRRGQGTARIITDALPRCLETFPQYANQDGAWSYVEGYKPDLRHLQYMERILDEMAQERAERPGALEYKPGRTAQ